MTGGRQLEGLIHLGKHASGGINLVSGSGAAREQHLADEAKSLRAEAECLPSGYLRNAVEEIAQFAEMLLSELRKGREEQRPPA